MIGDLGITPTSEDRERWLDQPLIAALTFERLAFALILILAIVSRLWDLGARVMSHDESLHTQFSWYLATGKGFSHSPLMHGPFLFHITALSYFLFGDNDFTARLPMAIFGIVTVMLPIAFRKQLGREGALAASFLLLISPSILYHARYIRQEATILVWTLLTVMCIWRYLETRQTGWLYGLAAALAFHGSDKSTSFFAVALNLVFLSPIALWQLYRARGKREDALKAVAFAAALGVLMLLSALVFELISGRISSLIGVESLVQASTATLDVNLRTLLYIAAMLGVTVLVGYLAITMLRKYFGDWMTLAHDRSSAWNAIVVLVSTTTLMGSPALLPLLNPIWSAVGGKALIDVSLLGEDINIKSNPQVISTMLALGLAVAMVGVVLALLWNWQRALAVFGIFVGITLPLFTTMFTNTAGVGTGYVGQLGYWMAQQGVMRGGQPWYYYGILVPLYEYVSLFGALCAGIYLIADIALRRKPGTLALVDKLKEHAFPLMLAWWALATWLIYSYAGEKMPWLTVHFALPQILLTAWFIQKLIRAIAVPQDDRARRLWAAAGLSALAVLFTVRALSVLGAWDGAAPRETIVAGLINGAIALMVIGVAFYFLRQVLARGVIAAFGLAVFALLSVFTVRTAVTAAYINYDYVREFLFYAHGAPGVKIITNQLDDLSRRLGVTTQLSVGYSQETSWPMTWYMREYPGQRFFGAELPSDYEGMHVIIIGDLDKKYNEWLEQLSSTYSRYDYTMVWWPMEDYKDMTWDRLRDAITIPAQRNAFWEIALNRNYEPYSRVFNKTSLTADTWQPSRRITMFVRNDIAQQVWDLRVGAVASGDAAKVAGPRVQQPANLAFAPSGERWVIDHKSNRLFRLDEINQPQQNVGGSGNQPGKFNDPWGLAIDASGYIYVADTFNHRVQKFDPTGGTLFAWGQPGATDAAGSGRETQFFGPRDIVIDGQGRLLVSDTGNKRIQVFDSEGNFIAQFGKAGAGDGQFNEPVGIALDAQGNIFVADAWNKRIQVWNPDFTFQRAFPVEAWEKMDPTLLQSVDHKPYLAISGDTLYVSSPRTAQVLGYTLAGQLKDLPGVTFAAEDVPTGVEVHNNALYVTNARNGAVVEFPLAGNAQ